MTSIYEIYNNIEIKLHQFFIRYVTKSTFDENKGIDPKEFAKEFAKGFLYNNSEQGEVFEKTALEYIEARIKEGIRN